MWTWVALDAQTKLVVTWWLGLRTPTDAREFMLDLAGRITNIAQLTTDGWSGYPEAVRETFGQYVNYAQLIKIYCRDTKEPETRYSPAKCIGTKIEWVEGAADPANVSTSHVERQNLTMRMTMRRFTRLTNAFSKKAENLAHALSLHYTHYNFVRKHQTLKTTPAKAAGISDREWAIADIVNLLEKKPNQTETLPNFLLSSAHQP